jgi:L,D-transpeptidase catalytic domain
VRQLLPILFAIAVLQPATARAQVDIAAHPTSETVEVGPTETAPITFTPGTGAGGQVSTQSTPSLPARIPRIACTDLATAYDRLSALYGKIDIPAATADFTEASPSTPQPANRLDRALLDTALASYRRHTCRGGAGEGPSTIIIVDFAKPSSQPRLYAVNLLAGTGIDTPIAVAHGIGSDPNDDGIADRFSNVYNSLASSLGAARGAELYHGQNGLSLRLDGLDFSNSQMRVRDIVAHSYAPERRRYFNASLIAVRGRPGSSEGCFVVAPEHRDWLFSLLANGGFLFAGLGGRRVDEMHAALQPPPPPSPRFEGEVVFVKGTGG